MNLQAYFPESDHEIDRLEHKTDPQAVIDQAGWAGLEPGMRVLDVGCGPGVTTASLADLVGPRGEVVGLDRSEERIGYARANYNGANITYVHRNFFADLADLGTFDFVWIRFILEYFNRESFDLARHVAARVKSGGIFCLADLDYNCLTHFGHSERLEQAFQNIARAQVANNNFDPFVGRKLYTYLQDLGFEELRADIRMHHLVCGHLSEFDDWNWGHKIEIAARRSGWTFDEYPDGFAGFEAEFKSYFRDPRRFTYTPLILARGVKP